MVKDVQADRVVVQDANKEMREIPYGLLVWATGNTSREITRNHMAKLPRTQTQRRGIEVDDYLQMNGAPGIYAVGDCTATAYAPTAQVASQQGMFLANMFGKMGQKMKAERQLQELKAEGGAAAVEAVEGLEKKVTRYSKLTPFHYSHQVSLQLSTGPRWLRRHELIHLQGSLAYIGSEKAIADLPLFNGNVASGGGAAMIFWRSAYVVSFHTCGLADDSLHDQSTLYSVRNRTLVLADWMKVKIFGR
jgi:NADH:ubiquinone reductase (non-electrogenic)